MGVASVREGVEHEGYIKASNTRSGAYFGQSVGISGDSVAVGSDGESSAATGINQSQTDTTAPGASAAYVR